MMPYRSTLLVLTCVTCIAIAPSSGRNLALGGEAIAQTPASTSPSPAAVRATPPATVLKQGDRGAEVVELQMKLKQLGYYTGAADGAFGETTKIAVAKFQKALKLPADGTVGATTWDKLQTAQDAKANPPKKSKPKAAAKPRSKKKMLFLLLSAIVVAATVGGSVYLLLKSFGKAINLEPEEDEADDANQQLQDNPFAPQNHRSNGIAAHTDTSSNGNSKNGYGSTEQFLADTTDTTGSYTSEDSSDIPHDLGNKTASPNVDGHLSNLSPQEEQAPQDPWLADSDRGAKGNAELPNVDKNFSKEEKIPDAPNPSGTSSSLSPTGDTKPQDGLQIEKTTKLPKIDIVEELIKDLQGGNSQKRRKAIWELAQRGDSRAVQPLVELMIDSDSQQRSLILEALSQICMRTLKPINRALGISLQDENADVRKNGIRDLTRIYELLSQINQMLRHATDDPDAEVKQTAQWALGQLNRVRKNSGVDNLPEGKSDERSP